MQAAAAAEAGASFIAPYVGRVTDWTGQEGEEGEEKGEKDEGGGDGKVEVKVERGVQLARDAQILYKARGWTKTKVRS